MNKQAYDYVVKARTVLILSQGFFGCLAMQLKLVEAEPDVIPTMAVDGVHMYYNPEFVLGLTEPELQGVVAHEVMHCAYKHMTRRQHREAKRWNWAGDYVINLDVIEAGFTLPGAQSCTMDAKWAAAAKSKDLKQVEQLMKQPVYLYNPKYKGMSTEEVYESLPEPIKIYLSMASGGEGEGEGQPNLDPTGCGAVLDASKDGDVTKAAEVEREWEGNVCMAVNVARANNAGKTPGYLERLVSELDQPRVSWRALTRNFIDNSNSKDFSFSRPNRRNHNGMMFPGYIPDRLSHLVMFVDNSGSIDGPVLKAFVSEVAGALDEGTTDKLTVVYADDGIRHVDEYVPGDLVEAKVLGGGGTDFRPSFDWLAVNAPDASACIYLTDMLTISFGEDVGVPTLWACYLPEPMFSGVKDKAPFGDVVHIDIL